MIESGYYPPGAEFDPNAPYNEKELPEKEIELSLSIVMISPLIFLVSVHLFNVCEY